MLKPNPTPEFIEKMRYSGKLASSALEMLEEHIKPGVTTNYLNDICHDFIVKNGAKPAPLGYRGFPKSICTSPNHVICHGIPNDNPLKEGDILNVDVSLSKDGAFGDTCKMYFVGKCSVMAKRIVQAAQECLYAGMSVVGPGVSIREIGKAIDNHARKYKYSVVQDYCGHGINTVLHSDPQIFHYEDPRCENFIMKPGLTFTIEPMINVGKHDSLLLGDGWTVVTRDKSLSAQFEHTILITDEGFDILTLRSEEDAEFIKSFSRQHHTAI